MNDSTQSQQRTECGICGDETAGPFEDPANPVCRACRECIARRTFQGDAWDKRLEARRRGKHRSYWGDFAALNHDLQVPTEVR